MELLETTQKPVPDLTPTELFPPHCVVSQNREHETKTEADRRKYKPRSLPAPSAWISSLANPNPGGSVTLLNVAPDGSLRSLNAEAEVVFSPFDPVDCVLLLQQWA